MIKFKVPVSVVAVAICATASGVEVKDKGIWIEGAAPKQATSLAVPTTTEATVYVRPFCKFGLQFLASSVSKTNNSNGAGGVAIVQVLGRDGKPLPCSEDVK